jgi:hypothetical protein
MGGAHSVEHLPGEGVGALLERRVELPAEHPVALGRPSGHPRKMGDGALDAGKAKGSDVLKIVQQGQGR